MPNHYYNNALDDIKQENSVRVEFIKRENEKLLRSIAREIGGRILAANGANLTELLRSRLPNVSGLTNSMGKKIDFRIAPDLALVVKSAKLTSQQNLPTTVKEAYQFDPRTGEKLRDGNGELMTLPTRTQTDHFDDDDNPVPYGEKLPSIIFARNICVNMPPPRLIAWTPSYVYQKISEPTHLGTDPISSRSGTWTCSASTRPLPTPAALK